MSQIINFISAGSGATTFDDSTFVLYDDGDSTKQMKFQVSGVTAGTTRTITMCDSDLDLTSPSFTGSVMAGTGITVNSFTQGVVLSDAMGILSSSAGIINYVLTSNGAGVIPTWQASTVGTVTSVTGGTNISTSGTATDPIVDLDAAIILTTVNATTFDTNVAAAAVTFVGTTLSADGTDANIDINITAQGTGHVIIDDLQVSALGRGIVQSTAAGILSSSEGTDGQIFVSSSTGAPVFANISSIDGSLTVTNGANTINIEGTDATTIQDGVIELATDAESIAGVDSVRAIVPTSLKAKLGTQTTHGLLVGSGPANAITALGVGGANTALLGAAGADPTWGSIPNATLTNSSVTLSDGNNITVTGSPLSLGGTASFNLTGTTDHSIQLGNAGGSLTSLGLGAATRVLTSAGTGTNPTWEIPTVGTVTSVTGGTNITNSGTATDPILDLDAAISGPTSITVTNGGSLRTGVNAADTLLLQAYDVDGASYTTFATLTANNDPSMDLNTTTTLGTKYIYRVDGTDVSVADGGTGVGSITTHALTIGNGTNPINEIAIGATNQVLLGNTGADPTWGAVDLTTDITDILPVANGGTNANTMATSYGVNYFDGTSIVTTAVGTAAQVLTSNGAGAAPTFQDAGSGGGTTFADNTFDIYDDGDNTKKLAFQVSSVATGTTRTITMCDSDLNLTSPSFTGSITAGTGMTISNFTQGVVLSDGTGVLSSSDGTTDYVLTSNGVGAIPTWQASTVGTVTSVSGGTNITNSGTATDPILDLDAAIALTTVNATTFDTNVAAAAVTLAGTTLSADGTDANIDINITPKGTGIIAGTELTLTTNLSVAYGGTGVSSLTDKGLLYGNGTSAVGALAEAVNGQLAIGSTGNAPTLATLTGGAGISVTNGAGSITVASTEITEFNVQTGTAYTLVLTDKNKVITMDNASANTLTVPPNSSVAFPIGTMIGIIMKGVGVTSIAADTGVTINSKDSNLNIDGQYSSVLLTYAGSDIWFLTGALST